VRLLRHAVRFAMLLALLACAGEEGSARAHCGTMNVTSAGATVTGAGVTVVIPRGALTASVEVSVCLVEVGRVPHQVGDMIEITPVAAALRSPVLVSLPVPSDAPAHMLAEIRDTPSGPLAEVIQVGHAATSATVTFGTDRFGDIRLLDDGSFAGLDAGQGSIDANRPDAPRTIGPVAVGPDLLPADYSCLGTTPTPSPGSLAPIRVHVVDWADGLPRSGYSVRAAPTGNWTTDDCTGVIDCAGGTTDASGDVTLMLRHGPSWARLSSSPGSDAAHTAAGEWVVGRIIGASATALDLTSVSAESQQALQSAAGVIGGIALGTIRDCAGAPVQRARVRLFGSGNAEVLASPRGAPVLTYGNGNGFPVGSSDRSTADGVFLVRPPQSPQDLRLEAWGRFGVDSPDVLLSCVALSVLDPEGLTMADLLPLPSDAPADCGSVP
jgi:hypothetical protein